MAAILARGTIVYLGVVNTSSLVLFGYDKHQASSRGWRVPERRLCNFAQAGGWVGGLVAMQLFRHKTRKESFQAKYLNAISVNLAYALPALFLVTAVTPLRRAFAQAPKDMMRALGGKKPPPRNPPRYRR